jgi:hypothetical protein
MIRMSLAAKDAEPRADDVSEILAQAQSLAEKVEAMPDCVMKGNLRTALAEILAKAGEPKSEVRHASRSKSSATKNGCVISS